MEAQPAVVSLMELDCQPCSPPESLANSPDTPTLRSEWEAEWESDTDDEEACSTYVCAAAVDGGLLLVDDKEGGRSPSRLKKARLDGQPQQQERQQDSWLEDLQACGSIYQFCLVAQHDSA